MNLPSFVQETLERELHNLSPSDLEAARSDLTQRYRQKVPGAHLQHPLAVAAYGVTRLPATYAVLSQIWHELQALDPEFQPQSLLDLGAGPGSASLAAWNVYPDLQRLHLCESHAEMRQLGQKILRQGPAPLPQAHWLPGNFLSQNLPSTDLTVASYVLNELSPSERLQAFKLLGARSDRFLVLVEPGTPEGFLLLQAAGQSLRQQNWQVWAPCPHQQNCPLPPEDWCHFACRLARSSLHRQLKGGSQGHEDEKFAYLLLSRSAPPSASQQARIIRHPGLHKGHVRLQVCTPTGLQEEVISKKQAAYKRARKLEWGQRWKEL